MPKCLSHFNSEIKCHFTVVVIKNKFTYFCIHGVMMEGKKCEEESWIVIRSSANRRFWLAHRLSRKTRLRKDSSCTCVNCKNGKWMKWRQRERKKKALNLWAFFAGISWQRIFTIQCYLLERSRVIKISLSRNASQLNAALINERKMCARADRSNWKQIVNIARNWSVLIACGAFNSFERAFGLKHNYCSEIEHFERPSLGLY